MTPQPEKYQAFSSPLQHSSPLRYSLPANEDEAVGYPEGNFLDIDSDEEEADCHSVYEIESDLDDEIQQQDTGVARYGLRRKGRRIVDISEDEDEIDHPTSSSAKRRKRTTVTTIAKKQVLSKAQPIKSFIPNEIWLRILSFCQPAFLARSRRISKTFKGLIDDEKLWRSVRTYHFPEYPEPILGVKEWEMWNLYLGVGCMICRAPKIRKSYWEFRIRCCKNCLKQGTIKEYVLLARSGFKEQWRDCLVSGAIDSWGNWTKSSVGGYYQNIWWLEDVKALETKMRSRTPVPIQKLRADVRQAEKDIAVVERFEAELARGKCKEADLVCSQRKADIKAKCLLIDPPITESILWFIPAYQAAISASRPLTERAWKMLLKKLEAGRGDAEKKYAEAVESRKLQKEREDAKALEMAGPRAKVIMKPLIDRFLVENGGIFRPGYEGSFAVRAFNYARSNWPATEKTPPPLGTLLLLWDRLKRFLKNPKKIFVCAFCSQKFALSGVFDHIAAMHSHEMGWRSAESQSCDPGATPRVYWPYREWPVELPIRGDDRLHAAKRASTKDLTQHNQCAPSILNFEPGTSSKQMACGKKTLKNLFYDHMDGMFSRIAIFQGIVPDSHRLFLWIHLSIASCLRVHKEAPDSTCFAHLADAIQMKTGDRMFEVLKCGICGAYQTRKRKPFTWLALSSHFGHDHRNSKAPWLEVFVKLPARVDIFRFCPEIWNIEARKQWIQLLKEADGELARMLDDKIQLEEEEVEVPPMGIKDDKTLEESEVPSMGIKDEGDEDVKMEEKEVSQKRDFRQETSIISGGDAGSSIDAMVIEATNGRVLKRDREIEPIIVQGGENGQETNDRMEHEKKKIKVESSSPDSASRSRDIGLFTDVNKEIEDLFADARD